MTVAQKPSTCRRRVRGVTAASFRVRGVTAASLIAIALGASHGTRAAVIDFDELNILGDSLSDQGLANRVNIETGLNFPLPLNPDNGRFSSGDIWADQFALRYPGVVINNQAMGGAMLRDYPAGPGATIDNVADLGSLENGGPVIAPLMGVQSQLAMLGDTINPNARNVVWAGANDILFIGLQRAAESPDSVGQFVTELAASMVDAVVSLASRGAQNIFVANVPDIGMTPRGIEFGGEAQFVLTLMSASYNQALAAALSADGVPPVQIIDMATGFTDVLANAESLGFTNTTIGCSTLDSGCEDGTSFFWDGIHPTTQGHAQVLRVVEGAVESPLMVPTPATLLLLIVGLGAVGSGRRVG